MAGTLREHIQAILDEHGKLTPELVVEVARDPNHPLHHRIEWDDSKAGPKWRLEQASLLIRKAKIVYRDDPTAPRDLRAFVSTRQPGERKSEYRPVEEVVADPVSREILLRQFERDWRAFKARWEHLAEFADIIRRDIDPDDLDRSA